MAEPFRKVQPGDPLRIPAEAWNALMDLSQLQRNQRHNQLSDTEGTSRQTSLAKVRNQTGTDLDRFSIVALGSPIVSPTDNLNEFKRQSNFQGILPAANTGSRFGVLLEPLGAGMIGTAAISGCVIARVSVGMQVYDCVETVPGEHGYLLNVPHGPASIMWMEATGSIRWAAIRFDIANYEEVVFITSNIPDANGYYPGVVQRFDVVSKAWNTVFNCKVVDANR